LLPISQLHTCYRNFKVMII